MTLIRQLGSAETSWYPMPRYGSPLLHRLAMCPCTRPAGSTSTNGGTSTLSYTRGIAQPRPTSDGRRRVLCNVPPHECTSGR